MRLINDGSRAINTVGLGMALVAVISTAGFVWGNRTDAPMSKQQVLVGIHHQCIVPAFDATASYACETEVAAYAAALLNLEVAQKNADDAYDAWYECEHGTPPPPPGDPIPLHESTVSILEQ